MKLLLSIGGASGSIYGIKLLEALLDQTTVEVHLVISDNAQKIISHETQYTVNKLKDMAGYYYDDNDLSSALASGSFLLDGMIIAPCSMKTLSAIANGYSETLTSRAASCCLKEGRKLVLVVRETPLDLPGIINMLRAKQAGSIILPAMPAFYHKPKKIDDLVNFIVGKIFDQFAIDHSFFKRWK